MRKHAVSPSASSFVVCCTCARLSSTANDNCSFFFFRYSISPFLADKLSEIHVAATSNGPNNLPVFLTLENNDDVLHLIVCADSNCSSFNTTYLGPSAAPGGSLFEALQMPNGRALFFFFYSLFSSTVRRLYCTSDDCSTFDVSDIDGIYLDYSGDAVTCDVGPDGNAWCFTANFVITVFLVFL